MPSIEEGNLTFVFPKNWLAEKYDQWLFHVRDFQHVCGGAKAVDILAVNLAICCWLIEIKDYRPGCRTTALELADTVAAKVRDTLAGLATARVRAAGGEQRAAEASLDCANLRIVLHMEQPATTSVLFPALINRANVLQRLRQLIKAIDPSPQVVDMNSSQNLPWTVT
jgi:hypothetical protein